jgi:hypothetical protein
MKIKVWRVGEGNTLFAEGDDGNLYRLDPGMAEWDQLPEMPKLPKRETGWDCFVPKGTWGWAYWMASKGDWVRRAATPDVYYKVWPHLIVGWEWSCGDVVRLFRGSIRTGREQPGQPCDEDMTATDWEIVPKDVPRHVGIRSGHDTSPVTSVPSIFDSPVAVAARHKKEQEKQSKLKAFFAKLGLYMETPQDENL